MLTARIITIDTRTRILRRMLDDGDWITINGSHVLVENGKITGGAGGKFNGKVFLGKKRKLSKGNTLSFGGKTKTTNLFTGEVEAMKSGAEKEEEKRTAKIARRAEARRQRYAEKRAAGLERQKAEHEQIKQDILQIWGKLGKNSYTPSVLNKEMLEERLSQEGQKKHGSITPKELLKRARASLAEEEEKARQAQKKSKKTRKRKKAEPSIPDDEIPF